MRKITQITINRFLELLKERNVECHALSVSQNGEVLIEKAFNPYRLDSLHPIYSVTKSFTSMAIGFLEQDGLIDLNDTWISYFPEYESDVADPRFFSVTIRTLLTMSLGQDLEVELSEDDDWVATVLGKELSNDPNSIYCYNSHCSHLLSALVTKVSNEKMVDYLKPRMFDPLKFKNYYWQEDKKGRNIGGYGLHVLISDLRKFGECCLNEGVYDGKQILPKEWIKKATSYQMKTANVYPLDRSENRQGYGYHFWMCTHGGYRCSGLHGQICFIQPENKLVVAMFNNTSGSQVIMDCLFDAIEEQPEMAKECEFRLLPVSGEKESHVLDQWLNVRAIACKYNNCFSFESLEMHKNNDLIEIYIDRDGKRYKAIAGYNKWYEQENKFHTFNPFWTANCMLDEQPQYVDNTLFASYAWESNTTLVVQIRELDHSAFTILKFSFDRKHIELYYNVTGLYTTLNDTKCTFYKEC